MLGRDNLKNTNTKNHPWESAWPQEGLELIMRCPICSNPKRQPLHSDLVDNTFSVAPGKWKLWQCQTCDGVYLDPRPTPNTLSQAYLRYYTHQPNEKIQKKSSRLLRKYRLRLSNGYSNWRYGTNEAPSAWLGKYLIHAMQKSKEEIDNRLRLIPRITEGRRTLLDVGCGNGSFLSLAQNCGWDVVGIDTDAKAVHNAIQNGVNAFEGGIEIYEGQNDIFDVITLSHVIEHVHDPVKLLKACHNLLKPGGQLWLQTPNIDSFGHKLFQKNWRGLESPRHLVLFNRKSLKLALRKAGFSMSRNISYSRVAINIYKASFAIAQRKSPYANIKTPRILLWRAKIAIALSKLLTSRQEFLTISATK